MFKVPKTSNRYVLLGRFISKTVPNNYMPQPNDKNIYANPIKTVTLLARL